MKKIVILVSGNGSNLQAVLDNREKLGVEVSAVVCNVESAFALKRAEKANVSAIFLERKSGQARADYDSVLAKTVAEFKPDFVFLLGWMRILTNRFLSEFKVVNLHPALPGTFPGTEAIAKQFEAFREGRISKCGIMTHYVPDEGVDSGPVILTREVEVLPDDSLDDFEARIHKNEHELVLETIKLLCEV